KSFSSYEKLKKAGADRYLLRHETATESHYKRLHPTSLSLENRKRCLFDLKKLGFQVGSGFMVGSPFQTSENLALDMLFLKELNPQMVGIGPFIPHEKTPFRNFSAGDLELTLFMVALTRLMLPKSLIPATTALASLSPLGREMGLKAGANVIMPNLSPESKRELYSLYNGKASTGVEAQEGLEKLKNEVKNAGFEIVTDKGDYKNV
ncbi:MAG: [Clostridia bacterium]|nr:[FeFe] hydrogenase H-cluster radical SAM maturase HydE [Clostridia bacterium]